MSKRGLFSRTAALAFALLVAASLTVLRAGQAPTGTVAIDADDIAGVVTGAKGPEAGVWVIAETKDTPTRLIKSVVIKENGAKSGVRLFNLQSIEDWLRANTV